MSGKISVIINTINEEKNVERIIKSVVWADEVVVCDMYSDDKTVEIARRLGAKVVKHERQDHVELVRNFMISQARNDWVLILDSDEEITEGLAKKLQKLAEKGDISFLELPRKNLIFGKWMQASMWWPDYNIRFFRKGGVVWGSEIHRPPEVFGEGMKLPTDEQNAIIHHHYESITQFIGRMDRYTSVQAQELKKNGYKFYWPDLIKKPLGEFLSRFFSSSGFKDGLHGLALSLLQAFSFLVLYLKIWEIGKFESREIKLDEFKNLSKKSGQEIDYWFEYVNLSAHPIKRFLQKVGKKIL